MKHHSDRTLDYFYSIDPSFFVVILALVTVIIALGVIGVLVWRLVRSPPHRLPPSGEHQ